LSPERTMAWSSTMPTLIMSVLFPRLLLASLPNESK